jgi:hypothetical protein
MSSSTIYSKTGKGAQVLTGKNKALSADAMHVLSHINGSASAESILSSLGKFTQQQFTEILSLLLEGGYIRIVADEIMQDFFSDSDSAGTINVTEISAEEFIKMESQAGNQENEREIQQQDEANTESNKISEVPPQLEPHVKEDSRLITPEQNTVPSLTKDMRVAATLKAREEIRDIERKLLEDEAEAKYDIDAQKYIAIELEAAEKQTTEAARQSRHVIEEKKRAAANLVMHEKAKASTRKQLEADAKAYTIAEKKRKSEIRSLIKAEKKDRRRAKRKPLDLSGWLYGTMEIARKLLVSLSVTILALLLLLQLVNLGMLVSPLAGPVEKLLSENINEPVTIRKIYASLWPAPHLVLNDITIGSAADIRIDTIRVLPVLGTLFDETKVLRYIKISGLTIGQDNLHRPAQWLAASKHGHLKFNRILLEKTAVSIHELELPAFDGEVDLTPTHDIQSVILNTNNHKTTISIIPRNGTYAVDLAAEDWPLPIGPPVFFDELHVTGVMDGNQFNFSQIKGRLYGGNLKASMSLNWAREWLASGNFKLSEVDMGKLSSAINGQASVDGPVTSSATFSLKADEFTKLPHHPEINANFSIDEGSINNIDLGKAMRASDKNAIIGSTHFNILTGKLALSNGNYQLTHLVLKAGQLNATGQVNIQENQDLSGIIIISLATKSRQMQSRLNLSGTLASPSLK